MWEDNEAAEGEDDDDEDEGLAGQLLSDLIASNKYGTSLSSVHRAPCLLLLYCFRLLSFCVPLLQMMIIMRMMRRMIQMP